MTAADRTFVAIAGEVQSVAPNSFMLDYGPGSMLVEMDDFDPSPEAGLLKVGDDVVVRGRVDQDLWEAQKIEA